MERYIIENFTDDKYFKFYRIRNKDTNKVICLCKYLQDAEFIYKSLNSRFF